MARQQPGARAEPPRPRAAREQRAPQHPGALDAGDVWRGGGAAAAARRRRRAAMKPGRCAVFAQLISFRLSS